jgi:hypothetical protein
MTTKLRKPLTLEIAHNIDGAETRLQSLLTAWRRLESSTPGGQQDLMALVRLLFEIQVEQQHIIQEQLRLLLLAS